MGKRRKLDAYYTPEDATVALINNSGILFTDKTLFECCDGDGGISKVLRRIEGCEIITNDINKSKPTTYHLDVAKTNAWEEYISITPDWVITNPPFNSALPILKNAYSNSCCGVILLLRLSFLEPTYERGDWLEQHPPDQVIVLPRISFTGDGKTDSVTVAWMIWQHGVEYSLRYPRGIKVISKGSKKR